MLLPPFVSGLMVSGPMATAVSGRAVLWPASGAGGQCSLGHWVALRIQPSSRSVVNSQSAVEMVVPPPGAGVHGAFSFVGTN